MTIATRNKIIEFFFSGWKFKDLVWLGTIAYTIFKFGMFAEQTKIVAYSKLADFDTLVVAVKENRGRLIVMQSSIDMYATKVADSFQYFRDKEFYYDEKYIHKINQRQNN